VGRACTHTYHQHRAAIDSLLEPAVDKVASADAHAAVHLLVRDRDVVRQSLQLLAVGIDVCDRHTHTRRSGIIC
jgi:hypothetical protein